MIVMDCVIDGCHLILIKIYASTKDHRALQNDFFNILNKQVKITLLIGGDFNTYLLLYLFFLLPPKATPHW